MFANGSQVDTGHSLRLKTKGGESRPGQLHPKLGKDEVFQHGYRPSG